jgi:membrane-bound ClpP family serine protease
MTSPSSVAALTAGQIDELNKQLATMRHDINNHLSLIMAAVELVRRKPEAAERMANTLTNQPIKITESMKKFSVEFENTFGPKRG